MRRIIIILLGICACTCVRAQISGVVLDEHGEPLVGANVYWAGTGVGVATDFQGNFTIMPPKSPMTNHQAPISNLLVFSFVGCHNDTITVLNREPLTIVLVDETILDEVTITERKMGVIKSRTSAFDTQTIGTEELCRAACCNLSEAFETNASVDVAYADAATGAKQIRLLGLSGTYVQLLQENTPAVRGLAQNFGLEYIPGPWMSSVQVSKGTSSVINGYEAVSGQINVELLKPQTQSPFSFNLMFNSELMAEANIMGGWQIPLKEEEHTHHHHIGEEDEHEHCHHESLYTGVMAHYTGSYRTMDENHDGFADMPLVQNANLANRWFYKHGDYTLIAFVRGLYDRRRGGQNVTHHQSPMTNVQSPMTNVQSPITNPYLINLNTWRVEGFIKNGYVYDDESGSSVALITSASYHNLDNSYGLRNWQANQLNVYVNGLWQRNWEGGGLIDNDHRLSAGVSVNFDKYNETLNLPIANDQSPMTNHQSPMTMSRYEVTPGLFAEYDYTYSDMLSLVAGVRADYSTHHGFFVTPRANVRYSPFNWWTLRASAGMGYRSPNAIADNAFILPSSRILMLLDTINQERAVNTGVSTTFDFSQLSTLNFQLSFEYYYTHFLNALIVDMDRDPHAVYFYNQCDMPNGKSFAHCAQVEASIEVLRGWTWTAAFRWTDVRQTTFNADNNQFELRRKALTNRFKGVITTSYQTPLKKWQFDLTAQFNGISRMPDGFTAYGDFLGGYGTPKPITWYPQLMAQITKYFRSCSLYLGAENMTNFRQDSPIIGADEPFGADFDASMVCGPTSGWKIYLGFRYDLE
ncbi:MAG: TonB-dependent receptor [Paludibacteraceae bacterium]|nr:TonB-dependent receptor [Paludibacteraceae bacterium]